MKIISWNCGGWACGGFNDERLDILLSNKPEIIIIQECTEKEFNNIKYQCKSRYWYGDDKEESYKGIALFSNTYNIKTHEKFNNNFRYVVPYEIDGLIDQKIVLLSVWTKKPFDGTDDYQKTIFDALNFYKFNLPLIVIGDFNTGANNEFVTRYNKLYEELSKYNLKNCTKNTSYEYEFTFYHDGQKKFYTNDYCFISEQFGINYINIPNKNEWEEISLNKIRWKKLSDHCPIEIDIKI
ncbi:endonuclease/exonuclease/phosphatase family protein [Spirochaetia bacterium]|nr:endonuclease/exonuclease/phosphatase family protein [Spirochaetia bacterium]